MSESHSKVDCNTASSAKINESSRWERTGCTEVTIECRVFHHLETVCYHPLQTMCICICVLFTRENPLSNIYGHTIQSKSEFFIISKYLKEHLNQTGIHLYYCISTLQMKRGRNLDSLEMPMTVNY